MRIVRILAIGLLAAGAACSRDTDGVLVTPDLVGGLRYMNLVSDTGAMDFRVIDIIGDAPNTIAASFRTGGQTFGTVNPSPTQPPYQPVRAGARNIRVFMSGTTSAIASTQMFDTTFTFEAGQNYTFYLHGTARTGVAGRCCSVIITKDSVPAAVAGKFHLRVLNLANTYAGSPAAPAPGAAIDVRSAATDSGLPTAAASGARVAVFANIAPGALSTYLPLDTTGTAALSIKAYRLIATANGATSPAVFQATLPVGVRGSATSNPFAGTINAGTAITAVILPRSTPASPAPQSTPTAVTASIDSVIFAAGTVTVVRSQAANTATVCGAPVAAGVALGDVLNITGLTQPEYNGVQVVSSVTAGIQATNPPTCTTAGTATPARSRFTYRIIGAPASPATGAASYKILTATNDFTLPSAAFLFDRQPARTAP